MSSPCCTSSPHEHCLTKTKGPKECTEEEWRLVSEGDLDPVSSDDEKMAEMQDEAERRAREEAKHLACEEAERKAEEECKVQKEVARVREEAERLAKEAAEREEAAKRVAEAAEERADAERRAIEERLWEVVGQQSEMVVAPLQVAKLSGRMTVGGSSAPACRASGVWSKKTVGESRKQKQAWRLEEMEEIEVVDVDEEEDEERPHFAVLQHLAEEHWDALGALMTTLDTLSTDFLEFRVIETVTNKLQRANNLKEEEMGRSKRKGKEKAQEEFRRARMEDDDGDMEMGKIKEKKNLAWGSEVGLYRLRVWSWLAGVPLVEVPNKFRGVPQL
ncbi:hypothetical protein ID866_12146, partial [Astraeus odoratus]